MSDTSGHDGPQPDAHTVTLRELEGLVAAEGVLISRRQLMRHCEAGTFDAKKLPATNNLLEWFIAPTSVEKGIADLKTLQAHRARRDASRHVTSGHDRLDFPSFDKPDTSGHDAPQHVVSDAQIQDSREQPKSDMPLGVETDEQNSPHIEQLPSPINEMGAPVMAGHDATKPDVSRSVASAEPAMSRYVEQLEREVEGLYDERDFYREQIKVKDGQIALKDQQIGAMLERDRETNILVQGLQKMLASPGREPSDQEGKPVL